METELSLLEYTRVLMDANHAGRNSFDMLVLRY